jgi:hypothetical protein
MKVVRMFATAVVFVLCALFGTFVGVALNSRTALLSGAAAGLLVGAGLASQVWRMPLNHAAFNLNPARRTPVRRASASRKRKRRR